jgi:hypothetical protein
MAREAGIYKDCDWRYGMKAEGDSLKAFQALVRADEREACAKVAENCFEGEGKHKLIIMAVEAAKAIRARGQRSDEASIRGNA